jgi:ribose-phosphate pyrophosphokinase
VRLFDISADARLGQRLSELLDVELSTHEERVFSDTEFKIRPLVSVRDQHVFVCQSLYSSEEQSANDRLVRLLFFIGALKDSFAARVTAIAPYLSYQRKDKRTKLRDPVSTRYLAQMLESTGLDGVITVDVHNLAAFENSFRCRKTHIEAAPVLVEHCLPLVRKATKVTVVSPDVGGVKRAREFASLLSAHADMPIGFAFIEKYRSEGVISGDLFAGDVENACVFVVDDMICGGTTVARAAKACMERGASSVHVAATHGVFGSGAKEQLAIPEISSVMVTDTIADAGSRCPAISSKLVVSKTAELIGAVVERLANP